MTSINEYKTAQKKVNQYSVLISDILKRVQNKTITRDVALVYEYYKGRLSFWEKRFARLEAIISRDASSIQQMNVSNSQNVLAHGK